MMEAGVVVAYDGSPLHWHAPEGRTGGSLPDSRDLWDVLWNRRDEIAGFAHSHPGRGLPSPSSTDITTFIAVEKALGRKLKWWIISEDGLALYESGIQGWQQTRIAIEDDFTWLEELRRISYGTKE